jgi:two-component system cell cycle sensor histidine kinase PleC
MSEKSPSYTSLTPPDALDPDFLGSDLEYISDAVLITEAEPFDKPGPRILWANHAFYQLTGYTSSEVLGKTPRILQGPLTDRATLDLARSALQKWEVARAEVLNYKKDGSTFWNEFEATPIANEEGFYTHWISIQRDVTERRESELAAANEELANQNKELVEYTKRIVNTIREPLILLDQDFKVVSVNSSFYQLFKVDFKDTIGININRLGNRQWDIPELQQRLKTILIDKASFDHYEVVHDFIGIGQRTMLLNARELEQVEGKGRLILLAIEDITERKRIESGLEKKRLELLAVTVRLERANQIKSEFLASMSHELRTPLNSIIGFSEVLKDDLVGKLTDEQYQYVRYIFDSGEHLLSLINDVLDLSKVEAGMMELNLNILSIDTILHDSLSMVKEKAWVQGIKLNDDVAIELGNIQVDGRKIKQIIYNLLSNAVKFTPSGGEVTLSALRVSRFKVGLPWIPADIWNTRVINDIRDEREYFDEFLEISVRDTGVGISAEDLNNLFQAFTQIDNSLSRSYEGTGLGLVLVRDLARLHGGPTAVSSAKGEGSCFTVWIPWRDASTGVKSASFTPLPKISAVNRYTNLGRYRW